MQSQTENDGIQEATRKIMNIVQEKFGLHDTATCRHCGEKLWIYKGETVEQYDTVKNITVRFEYGHSIPCISCEMVIDRLIWEYRKMLIFENRIGKPRADGESEAKFNKREKYNVDNAAAYRKYITDECMKNGMEFSQVSLSARMREVA